MQGNASINKQSRDADGFVLNDASLLIGEYNVQIASQDDGDDESQSSGRKSS